MNWLADKLVNLGRGASPLRELLRPIGIGQPVGTRGWLYQLRWFAVVGQFLTIIGAATLYSAPLPLPILIAVVAFTAGTNIGYGFWLRWTERKEEAEAPSLVDVGVMFADLVTLAFMLFLTGGSANPFGVFFFVNLAVAGVILRPQWAWILTLLAVAVYVVVALNAPSLPVLEDMQDEASWLNIRLQGRIAAFAACSMVITYFVTRLADELKSRQQELQEVQQQRDRSQRLEALATLAAGAAHELASPLSTIAVVAREMSRHLEKIDADSGIRKDISLIDGELEHCRQILSRMRSSAGDSSAETWGRATLGDLMDASVEGVREPNRIDVTLDEADEEVPLWIPVQTVAQVIRNLLHNALDASPPGALVLLTAVTEPQWCRIEVIDEGHGMSEDVKRRLGEPFFTTKEPGRGMGLGVFLTRNVVSRLGGHLQIESELGKGSRFTVLLPRQVTRTDKASGGAGPAFSDPRRPGMPWRNQESE